MICEAKPRRDANVKRPRVSRARPPRGQKTATFPLRLERLETNRHRAAHTVDFHRGSRQQATDRGEGRRDSVSRTCYTIKTPLTQSRVRKGVVSSTSTGKMSVEAENPVIVTAFADRYGNGLCQSGEKTGKRSLALQPGWSAAKAEAEASGTRGRMELVYGNKVPSGRWGSTVLCPSTIHATIHKIHKTDKEH